MKVELILVLKIVSATVSFALCSLVLAILMSDSRDVGVPIYGRASAGTALQLEAAAGAAPVARDATVRVRTGTRNPLKHPFSTRSIWNMPIGTNARYVPAQLSTVPRGDTWAPMPMADQDNVVLRPGAPRTRVMYSTAGWGGDRCQHTGQVLARAPFPKRYTLPSSNMNESTTFLRSDRRTIVQLQPFARCSAGGVGTAIAVWPDMSLYGEGIRGAHGGSGLSALGGTLRVGELRPSTNAPRHALKMLVDGASELSPCSTQAGCFRWPATKADSDAVSAYGSVDGSAPSAMRMGALLAIPQALDLRSLGLKTSPGKKLAWTLQNYGAYIVDDTAGPGIGFATEKGPAGSFMSQFRADYGTSFQGRTRDTKPWVRDIRAIVSHLSVVSNNGPNSIGGGGTPLQPLAAPLGRP